MKIDKDINVLGTPYSVIISDIRKDSRLKIISGYCDDTVKRIVINDYSADDKSDFDKFKLDLLVKKNIRHELLHAFLFESGLAENSDWATCEEMVDWFARQGLKIYKAWKEAGATDE